MNIKSYPTLKKSDFPLGAKCSVATCPNKILPGMPYDEVTVQTGVDMLTVDIVCVYH